MFPARFQVIDVNRRYVESESEFDKKFGALRQDSRAAK